MSNKKETINFLLMEQFGVLSRIDLNSDLFIKFINSKPFFKSTIEKRIKENRLDALDMSKKLAHACRMVMRYHLDMESLEETLSVLKDAIQTDYNHPYSVSACWNLVEIYNLLIESEETIPV